MKLPRLLKATLAWVLAYGGGTVAALAATMVAHHLTDRAIWGVFPMSYRVREMSLYFLDVLPIYLLVFMVLAAIARVVSGPGRLGFARLLVLGLAAVPVAITVHAPLFPWSAPSTVMLALFAAFFVSAYAVIGRVVAALMPDIPLLPRAAAVGGPAVATLAAGILFVGGLTVATQAGLIDEQETFRPGPWPTPAAFAYRSSENRAGGPRIDLLTLEALPEGVFGGRRFEFTRVLDINLDGFMDVVFKDNQGFMTIALNEQGSFRFDEALSQNVEGGLIGNFAFADFNDDKRLDFVFDRPIVPAPPGLASVSQGNMFWNFAPYKGGYGHLKLGAADGPWPDATARVFPGGAPTVALKSEPILVFDANGDGRLDFLWSGYPRPRDRMQKLYVQQPDGTFVDEIDSLLDHVTAGVYPEGSDVADIDGDGDIDFFGIGYLYLNEGGRYRQVCGQDMPGFNCDAVGRNEEGVSFEDMDGDGHLDMVVSYHGAGASIPKYRLQFFRGGKAGNGIPVRATAFGRAFYGAHYYLRAQDFDFNGKREIILWNESRIVTLDGDTWTDLMPALARGVRGLIPVSWIDIDEDGDWDILATVESGRENYLLRNGLNPERYVKLSALGAGGAMNQAGATFRITLPGGRRLVQSYRPIGGYNGTADPRVVFPLEAGFDYRMNVCFPSLAGTPKAPPAPIGVRFEITGVKGKCVDYAFSVNSDIQRLDLKLIAGAEGARMAIAPSSKDLK